MSLARTALRLAAVAALGADPVVSALCGPRIYDSLIDELDARVPVPVLVVYTEDDNGKAWSVNNGGPPFDHACDLLLEISMRLSAPDPDNDDDVIIGVPGTDAEMEATLDLLEECAITAVTVADTPQARLIRSAVTRRTAELRSIRYASAETGAKIAMRIVTLTTHLKIDQPDVLNPPCGVFAALPAPLRNVAGSLDPASSGYATCLALAARLTPPAAVATMTGVDIDLVPYGAFDPANPPVAGSPDAAAPILQPIDIP